MGEVRLGRLFVLFALAAAVVLPVRSFIIEPIYVPTASMEPTLRVGAHLFCDKLTLRWRDPRRGDIVVLKPPTGEAEQFVKRVIGLPGESVELKEKQVFVDGRALEEPYAVHKRAGETLSGDTQGPWQVPARSYFVLGDNRDESDDSSVWKDAQGERRPFVARDGLVCLVRGVY